jgi:cytochrome c oxidase subunit 2
MRLFSYIQVVPPVASSVGARVDSLVWMLIAVSGFFVLLIFGLLIAFCVKYQKNTRADRKLSTKGQTTLEIVWTAVPTIIGLAFFVWGASLYIEMVRIPKDGLEVYVVARQWMWKLQHADGPKEINELHIPVGKPVKLIMISQDVIHSFFVPAFRAKRDVLPGRYESMWFQPTQPGEYRLFCAEYCGDQHSRMVGRVFVMRAGDYIAWAGARHEDEPSIAGRRVFEKLGCASCHGTTTGARGPSLAGLYGSIVSLREGREIVADDEFLRESILSPGVKVREGFQNLMPAYQGQIDFEEMSTLLIYLKSLRQLEVTSK